MSQHNQIVGPFRTSHHSNTLSGILNCVAVASLANGGLAIRNSKDPDGATLFFTYDEIAAFFAGVKEDEFGEFPVRASA